MKNYFLLTLLIVHNMGFAQDCGDVKDGESKRLDAPGGSLEHARVQDQDGLGTCYANTASLMLQSALPNSPEVSYLQLAINKAQLTTDKDLRRQGKKQAFTDKGDLLLDAGHSCEAIKLAKSTGGVCERKDVALEQLVFNPDLKQFNDDKWIQLDLLKKVSTYYDGMLKDFGSADEQSGDKAALGTKKKNSKSFFDSLFGSPSENEANSKESEVASDSPADTNKKFSQYKAALKMVIDQNRDEYAKKSCTKADSKNVEVITKNIFVRIQNKLSGKISPGIPASQYSDLKSRLGLSYELTSNGIPTRYIRLDDRFKDALGKDYINNLMSPAGSKKEKPITSGLDAFKKSLKKNFPSISPKLLDEVGNEMSPDDLNLLNTDYKRYVLKDFSDCINQGRVQYMKNEDGLIHDFQGTGCSGEFLKHVKNLQDMVVGLDKNNFNNIDQINDFISNLPNLSYEQAMMKLLAPNCSDDKKIKIPDDFKCNIKSISMSDSDKATPESQAKYLAETKKDFFETTKRNITGNRAIGLSMCTTFFEKSTADVWYNRDRQCDLTKKHGMHAVTMIGYKCDKSQMKYLIQNSWGLWDSSKETFDFDSYGKAWIKDDALIKNAYQMDLME